MAPRRETQPPCVPPKPSYVSYWMGDIVYLRHASEERRGMVTGVMVIPCGWMYLVSWEGADNEQSHYEIELSSEYVPMF